MASKRRGLKVAFVVTVAATSALASGLGCGSSVDVPQSGTGGVVECPAGGITAGQACFAGQSCAFGDTGCGVSWDCVGGQWQNTSPPCNPPPPEECPDLLPGSAEPCWSPGLTCTYADVCEPSYATCEGGAWTVTYGGCVNPPPVECPFEPPLDGDPCYGLGICSYVVETACGLQDLHASCDDLSWSVPDLVCPDPPPPGPCPSYATDADCWADPLCRWLTPGCGDPPLPAAGCFAAADCSPGDCPAGTTCQLASSDCINCQTCDMGVMVCLP